jgi:signal transduction histidine kinase
VANDRSERSLLSPYVLLTAWAPVAVITILHYATGEEVRWFHDILRRLYYLPILFAAFAAGLRGGLTLALAVALLYSPHAFTHVAHTDPAGGLEKALELLLYVVVGVVGGVLVDRERAGQRALVAAKARLEQALEAQRRTADQLVRAGRLAALGELVAGIAHEIKNPLHALKGTAEVVDAAIPADARQRRMWEVHVKELDRLAAVSERFLSFARPSPPEPRPVDLRDLLERARELLAAQARKQKVEVIVDEAAREQEAEVVVDEQQIAQVLVNIGINALQAVGDEGGLVRLGLEAARRSGVGYWGVSVVNSGPPIPDTDLERIFDPFVTAKAEGIGLGLSIASRIAEQHGGFIEARNLDERRGVAFDLFLPREPESPGKDPAH